MDDIVNRSINRPYDIPLNVAIWMAFKPILKVYLSIGTGFFLSKSKILTPQLSKDISRLVLIIFVPCLLFSNIVLHIKSTDAKLFGVIVFTGFMYFMIGLGWSFVVRLVTPIPRAWLGGLILCCMLNNCNDLPLAYVQTIGKSPLFPPDASSRGQSYSVLMVIIFIIINFNLGGTRLVEWDATREDPRRNEPTVPPISWSGITLFLRNVLAKTPKADDEMVPSDSINDKILHNVNSNMDIEAQITTGSDTHPENYNSLNAQDHSNHEGGNAAGIASSMNRQERLSDNLAVQNSRVILLDSSSNVNHSDWRNSERTSQLGSQGHDNIEERLTITSAVLKTSGCSSCFSNIVRNMWWKRKWLKFKEHWFIFKAKNKFNLFLCNAIEDIFLPQMLSLIAGIAVAMIPWVRRVFVKGQHVNNFHDAPDGNPPLDFIMDYLSFFAASAVPLGLMLLGGTIASLKPGRMVKGFWKSLIMITTFKLVILPIIACAWIHKIKNLGWIDDNDVMTPIVLAVGSATPPPTVQIYLTLQWMDPTQESVELNALAMVLLTQYALLPISLTILMTYIVMNFV